MICAGFRWISVDSRKMKQRQKKSELDGYVINRIKSIKWIGMSKKWKAQRDVESDFMAVVLLYWA